MSLLRRILGLSILYASVLFAGAPAMSCADTTPAHDCCPPQPGMPCRGGESGAAKTTLVLSCCVAGAQNTVTAAAVPSRIEKHAASGTPALRVSCGFGTAAYAPCHSTLAFKTPVYYRSQSTLYLSTGRLRL